MSNNLPSPPNYQAAYALALKERIKEVPQLVKNNDSGMMYKINKFCEKYNFDNETIRNKIVSDSIFAVYFAVDPAKQKLHENLAAEYIKKLHFVKDFKQLNASDMLVSQGMVISKQKFRNLGGTAKAKTIDFFWRCADKNFYASHKHTKESGGSQDNQYNDLKNFLSEANQSTKSDNYFLAIADGPYYQQNDKDSNTTKIENLKNIANEKHCVFALTIEELASFLQNSIKISP